MQDVTEMLKSTPTIVITIRYYINRRKYQRQVLGRFKSAGGVTY